jgi:hypothetical protein
LEGGSHRRFVLTDGPVARGNGATIARRKPAMSRPAGAEWLVLRFVLPQFGGPAWRKPGHIYAS